MPKSCQEGCDFFRSQRICPLRYWSYSSFQCKHQMRKSERVKKLALRLIRSDLHKSLQVLSMEDHRYPVIQLSSSQCTALMRRNPCPAASDQTLGIVIFHSGLSNLLHVPHSWSESLSSQCVLQWFVYLGDFCCQTPLCYTMEAL